MSKAKKLGKKTSYIPNAKADMRHHKKVYQRGREKPMIRSQIEGQAVRKEGDKV